MPLTEDEIPLIVTQKRRNRNQLVLRFSPEFEDEIRLLLDESGLDHESVAEGPRGILQRTEIVTVQDLENWTPRLSEVILRFAAHHEDKIVLLDDYYTVLERYRRGPSDEERLVSFFSDRLPLEWQSGDVLARFGGWLRRGVAPKHVQRAYARSPEEKQEERKAKEVKREERRERRRSFRRDVAVQFFGSIAAAYFVIALAVAVGYLKNPLVVGGILGAGLVLLVGFIGLCAFVCIMGAFGQIRTARLRHEALADDRSELIGLSVRFISLIVAAIILVGIAVTMVIVTSPWLASIRFPVVH